MKFLLIAAVVVIVLFALAWWSSGRARTGGRLARSTRVNSDNQAMRQHRPSDGGWSGSAGV